MKNIIKVIIAIILAILLTVVLMLCGIKNYILNADEQVLKNFVEYNVPLLKEYGTSDVIKVQGVIEKRLEEEFEKGISDGSYTADSPYIVKNPYGRATLAAYVAIPVDSPVKYTYTVQGKTDDVDFTYSTDEYTKNAIMPVVALYNNYDNVVDVTLEFKDGTRENYSYTISMAEEVSEEATDGINIQVNDEASYTEVLDGKIIFDGSFNGYDTNGDLRYTGFSTYRANIKKPVDGRMLVGYDLEAYDPTYYISPRFFEMNAMGRFNPEYILEAPKGYGFHHDVTYDETTNSLYALTAPVEGHAVASEEEYAEGGIAVYDADTLKLKDHFNLTDQIPTDSVVGKATDAYDIHFNGLDYDSKRNEVILSGRSTSELYGINMDTHEISWVLGDPQYVAEELQDVALTPIGDNMEYTRGQHSVFIEDNPYYQSYYDEGKTVITVFDNQSHEGGYSLLNGEEYDANENGLEENSRIMTYAIDFENKTFELINKIQLTANSPFVSNVYDTENYMVAFITLANTMNVVDFEGNLAIEVTGMESVNGYRGYIYSNEQIAQGMSFKQDDEQL